MRSILRSRSTLAETHDVVYDDNLSTWEMVSDSLSDDDECSFYDDDAMGIVSTDGDEVISDEPESKIEKEGKEGTCVSRDLVPDLTFILPLLVPPPMSFPLYDRHDEECVYDDDDVFEEDVSYDDDDDDDDDDDVEDELVPCKFKNRFRMGKTGGPKPKLSKSKKLPYYYNNPRYAYL